MKSSVAPEIFTTSALDWLFDGFDVERFGSSPFGRESLAELPVGLKNGWSAIEGNGVWSNALSAEFKFAWPKSSSVSAIEFFIATVLPNSIVSTRACGLTRLHKLTGTSGRILVPLRAPSVTTGGERIVFNFLNSVKPVEIDLGDDIRDLGIFVIGCRTIDDVEFSHILRLQKFPWFSLDAGEIVFGRGWGEAEGGYRWTVAKSASFLVGKRDASAELQLQVAGFCEQGHKQSYVVTTSKSAGSYRFDCEDAKSVLKRIPLNEVVGVGESIWVNVQILNPLTPLEAGVSADRRPLGLMLHDAG